MKPTLFNLVQAVWIHRDLILAVWPLVVDAQRTFPKGANADKKAWVSAQLNELKRFTPANIDLGIDAVVQLLQLFRLL